jgi:amino acid transporter
MYKNQSISPFLKILIIVFFIIIIIHLVNNCNDMSYVNNNEIKPVVADTVNQDSIQVANDALSNNPNTARIK